MDEAYVIFNYLPSKPRSLDESKYMDFLWDSFHSNYENNKFQFAFLAFHMIYMCFIYEVVWKIRVHSGDDFEKSLTIVEKSKAKMFLDATSPFTFGEEKEKLMFRFLKLLDATNEEIGNWSKVVDYRNISAHPNGVISFSEGESLDNQISTMITHVDDIHNKTYPILDDLLSRFLRTSWNSEENSFSTFEEEINQNLIAKQNLSVADVMYIRTSDLAQLSDDEHFGEMSNLFDVFKQITDSWGE